MTTLASCSINGAIYVYSLLRRVQDKLNTFADVAFQTAVAGLEERLLVFVCTADDVDGLFGTTRLLGELVESQLIGRHRAYLGSLTPSSIGTEKNSFPVTFAMASPPCTPGR
jgi:hypothetical protein